MYLEYIEMENITYTSSIFLYRCIFTPYIYIAVNQYMHLKLERPMYSSSNKP